MSAIKNKSQFVICGTDTDIGKTLISSFFVRGLNSFYWKPIQSGINSETDSQSVARLAKVNKAKIINEAYIFREPVSPHWASEIDQKVINSVFEQRAKLRETEPIINTDPNSELGSVVDESSEEPITFDEIKLIQESKSNIGDPPGPPSGIDFLPVG